MHKKADAYAAVYAGGVFKFASRVVENTTDPFWNQVGEFFVEDIPSKTFEICIHHAKSEEQASITDDPVLASWKGEGSDIVDMFGCYNKYLTLSGPKALAPSVNTASDRHSIASVVEQFGKLRVSLAYFPVFSELKAHGLISASNSFNHI